MGDSMIKRDLQIIKDAAYRRGLCDMFCIIFIAQLIVAIVLAAGWL